MNDNNTMGKYTISGWSQNWAIILLFGKTFIHWFAFCVFRDFQSFHKTIMLFPIVWNLKILKDVMILLL